MESVKKIPEKSTSKQTPITYSDRILQDIITYENDLRALNGLTARIKQMAKPSEASEKLKTAILKKIATSIATAQGDLAELRAVKAQIENLSHEHQAEASTLLKEPLEAALNTLNFDFTANAKKDNRLMAAAREGLPLDGLLELGADPNVIKESDKLEPEENNKLTALHLATIGGHTETAKTLIKWRADVQPATTDGFTALHLCADSRKPVEMAKILVEAKADQTAVASHNNQTPLTFATVQGQFRLAQYLKDCAVELPEAEYNAIVANLKAANERYLKEAETTQEKMTTLYPEVEKDPSPENQMKAQALIREYRTQKDRATLVQNQIAALGYGRLIHQLTNS